MWDQEYSRRYINETERINRVFLEFIGEKPVEDVDKMDIKAFLSAWEPGKNRLYYRTLINRFLQYYGNGVISQLHFKDPRDVRPNARWLTPDEERKILSIEMDSFDALVTALAFDHALRRCEIERLRPADVDTRTQTISIRGKGAIIKSVPMSPDFPEIFKRFVIYRQKIIEECEGDKVPKELLIRKVHGHIMGCKRSCLDQVCIRGSGKVGFRYSFHDLRRTWARRAFELDVPFESIGYILGHKDPRQTLRYIGADLDHGREAVNSLYEYRQRQKKKEVGFN
jgi:integrase